MIKFRQIHEDPDYFEWRAARTNIYPCDCDIDPERGVFVLKHTTVEVTRFEPNICPYKILYRRFRLGGKICKQQVAFSYEMKNYVIWDSHKCIKSMMNKDDNLDWKKYFHPVEVAFNDQ